MTILWLIYPERKAMLNWDEEIKQFVACCAKHKVKMLLVGGGAVNFHGYQRHSADIDFWIDTREENLIRLLKVFHDLGFEIDSFPNDVALQHKNISVKFSPASLSVELITKFNPNKSFDEAYETSIPVELNQQPLIKYRVLSLEDLITSKIKAGRPKDLLDIQELKRINEKA